MYFKIFYKGTNARFLGMRVDCYKTKERNKV